MSETSDDDADDVIDDAEFEKQKQRAQAATKNKRSSISAERWSKPSDWKPPVHKKTAEQYEQIRSSVAKSFIFSTLSPALMKQVVDAFEGPQHLNKGTEVIKQGDVVGSGAPGLYVLEFGSLSVFKRSGDEPPPGPQVFSYDKAGSMFGELALLYNCPRAATVTATSDSVVWSIDRDTFNNCVKSAQQETQARRDRLLREIDIMQDLSASQRARVADVIRLKTYQQGDVIFHEGEEGACCFFVETGSAHAEINGTTVKVYGPGEYFGELALIKGGKRRADIIVDESPTVVGVLEADAFQRLLGPVVQEHMAANARTYQPAPPAKNATGGSEDGVRVSAPRQAPMDGAGFFARLFGCCSCNNSQPLDGAMAPSAAR
eukprot:gnl/TRDRNA2_/TRDRNA2_81783_c0_seq1.p1 gnl/TRDRNA2_/TRDRNA2_81783_c0~~gnl/TRDRNA2_/TRDRNA2_81783_c0_seq1.p1  ORF type:complete len:375 (-),score=79.15 gnl/TRDRNA2_/TRDRNA2_81783_c0_seq1:25-1149(-)